jgi:hypothetical protein
VNYSRIGEVLYGAFNDILRTAGIVVGMDKLDAMRMRCEDLGAQLERIVHNKAINTTKKLQQATVKGFESFEEEQDRLEKRVAELEYKLRTLQEVTRQNTPLVNVEAHEALQEEEPD